MRQLERATQNLVLHKGRGGSPNLCVASSFATYWLIPRLGGFVAAHPAVTLNLSTHIEPVDFSSSPHDAALESCEGPSPGLHAQPVLALEVRPCAAPGLVRRARAPRGHRPRSREGLRCLLNAHALIRHSTVPLAWPHWLASARLQDAIRQDHLSSGPQYDLLSMALNGAIAGLGIALLPDYVAG